MAFEHVPRRKENMFYMSQGSVALWLPNPDKTSGKGTIATFVNSGRNTLAVVTAQKIGRDQEKITLEWNWLHKEVWEALVAFWDKNFFFNFRFYSPVAKTFQTRKCYVGDRDYKPFDIDPYGIPTAYENCKANIIDTGA